MRCRADRLDNELGGRLGQALAPHRMSVDLEVEDDTIAAGGIHLAVVERSENRLSGALRCADGQCSHADLLLLPVVRRLQIPVTRVSEMAVRAGHDAQPMALLQERVGPVLAPLVLAEDLDHPLHFFIMPLRVALPTSEMGNAEHVLVMEPLVQRGEHVCHMLLFRVGP